VKNGHRRSRLLRRIALRAREARVEETMHPEAGRITVRLYRWLATRHPLARTSPLRYAGGSRPFGVRAAGALAPKVR
jgi:hypothetical protein